MRSLAAGKLNRRVTYQLPVETNDPFGQAVPTAWTDVYTCWAHIRGITGREALIAAQVKAVVSHTLIMRYQGNTNPVPEPTGRFLYTDPHGTVHVFNITYVSDVDEKHSEVNVFCLEIAAPVAIP